MTPDDQKHGKELGYRFLELCEAEGATGVALLNAIGNALVGYFMVTKFENHQQRMQEVDQWCAALRREVDTASRRTGH